MNSTEALREIAEKWGCRTIPSHDFTDDKYEDKSKELLSALTALIREHYVAKEEVDKMVSERLREAKRGKSKSNKAYGGLGSELESGNMNYDSYESR